MKSTSEVSEYIANFPKEVRERLEQIRKIIKEEVPEIEEKISYGIPATTLNGKYFVYFAGFKNHIGIYPVTKAMENFIKEIGQYRTGKGTLQFLLDKPLPMSLIRKIIKVRVKECLEKD